MSVKRDENVILGYGKDETLIPIGGQLNNERTKEINDIRVWN